MASFTTPDSVAASFTPPIGRLAFPGFSGLCLELSTECLVQQGFFQGFQRGELLLVDGFEALRALRHLVCILHDGPLLRNRTDWDGKRLDGNAGQVPLSGSICSWV